MYKYIVIFVFGILCTDSLLAQGFVWGPKGGFTLAGQNFTGYQRDLLSTWHGSLFIENLTEENKYGLYAQIGYHNRGSAIRTQRFVNMNGQTVGPRSFRSEFGNIALQLGGKQKFDLGVETKWYFGVGLRGEYNVNVSIPEIYPNIENLTKKFVYGANAMIGIEYMFDRLAGVVVEFNVAPDFSDQIIVPAQRSVTNPNRIIPEQKIRNISYEISLGFRLVREVIYVD